MKRSVLYAFFGLVFTLTANCIAYGQTPSQNAKTFGQESSKGLETSVANDPLQKYGGAPVNSGVRGDAEQLKSLYQNGKGSLFEPGAQKMQQCEQQADDGSPAAKECAAINFIARNPQQRPQITVKQNDPLIQNSGVISQGAAENIDASGKQIGSLANSYSACTSNNTSSAFYKTEICREFREQKFNNCPVGQQIVVDANTNYQCDATPKVETNQTCNRVLNVSCVVNTLTETSPTYISDAKHHTLPRALFNKYMSALTKSGLSEFDRTSLNTYGLLVGFDDYCKTNGYDSVVSTTWKTIILIPGDWASAYTAGYTVCQRTVTKATCTDSWNNQCATLEGKAK